MKGVRDGVVAVSKQSQSRQFQSGQFLINFIPLYAI